MERTILNTRPEGNRDEFETILEKNNFRVLNFPLIEIAPVEDYREIDGRLDKINNYDGIIFTSGNAVKIFLGRAAHKNINIETKIFAVGDKTKRKIEEYGYECEELPDKSDSATLAKYITEKYGRDKRYLFPKGRLGMNRIGDSLSNVDEIIVYDTVFTSHKDGIEEVNNLLNNKGVDCVVFFSPSAVKNFFFLFPGFRQKNTAIAVIGETTKKSAENAGLKVSIMPERYVSEEVANEIIKYFK